MYKLNNFENINDFYFNFPASVAILGSSRAGTTAFLTRILTRLDQVCNTYLPVSKLYICYQYPQKWYDTIILHLENQFKGLETKIFDYYPEAEMKDPEFFKVPLGTMGIIIFDDLTDLIKPSFENLLRKTCHHSDFCLFLISQDSSSDPKHVKNALRSVNYVVIMNSSQPGIFLHDLSRKYLPNSKNYLFQCFNYVLTSRTSPFFPYLILDLNSYNNKLKTGIFEEEIGTIFRLQ